MRADGRVVCNAFTFVDDKHVTSPDEKLTWQANYALASKQSYLGIQDAGRKARPSSTGVSHCSHPTNVGCVFSHIKQVVEASGGGYGARALSQGALAKSGFSCTHHKEVPNHGALPQGLSPDHQDVEGQT